MILDNATKLAETITEEYFLKQVDDKYCVYRKRKICRARPSVYVVADSKEEASVKAILKLRKEHHTIIDYTTLTPNINIIDGEVVCKR